MNSETRQCQNCKSEFVIEPDDFGFYEKIKVPPPTWCPKCRMVRRMNWRNESTLYRRTCDLCGKSIITMYAPDSPFHVYCHECWMSDRWDAKECEREYDWNIPFFLQFRKLLEAVPLVVADMKGTMVNSEYGNYNGNCKNCYMCFSTALCEDALYCSYSEELKQCMDSTRLRNAELCYEAVESEKNYGCTFVERTRESSDSHFLFDCSNASHCFMSANLRNRSYVLKNEQLSAEEYTARMRELDLGSSAAVKKLQSEFAELKKIALCKHAEVKNTSDVTGNNIMNSKHVRCSFDVNDSENINYSFRILKNSRDIYDCHGMVSGELVYEGFGCGFSPRNNLFSFSIDVSRNLQYCAMCRDCSDCFGCIGLKNQRFCIFNKQYSEEEYGSLAAKIREHMMTMPYTDKKDRAYAYGEFFPPELSPFAYNETIAQDYFPLAKNDAERLGYHWKDDEKRTYSITLPIGKIPDNVKDADESITGEVIECAHKGECNERCSTAFKITPQELQLYKKMNTPLPYFCPNCRHFERLRKRNPLKLWHRKCMCLSSEALAKDDGYRNTVPHFHGSAPCPNEFKTSYAPDRPEIVYCESCYQAEVV